MRTGPDRFDRLTARTVDMLCGHTNLDPEAARSILSGLTIEHEVLLRRHVPRLYALQEMGRLLDDVEIRWSTHHWLVARSGWGITVSEAAEGMRRLTAALKASAP